MATVVTPALTATGVDVVVDPSGTYRVVHNGAVLLESAEAGACGIQHEGKWCTCKTGSPEDGAAAGIDDNAACYLHLLNQSRTEGSDALGLSNVRNYPLLYVCAGIQSYYFNVPLYHCCMPFGTPAGVMNVAVQLHH